MHLGCQFFLGLFLVLLDICQLSFLYFFYQIGCSCFVIVHKLVPFLAKLFKLCLLLPLSLADLVIIKDPQILIPSSELSLPNFFNLLLGVLRLLIIAIFLALLPVIVQKPTSLHSYFKKSMSRSSTFLQRAYFSSTFSLVFSDRAQMKRNSSKETRFSKRGKLIK